MDFAAVEEKEGSLLLSAQSNIREENRCRARSFEQLDSVSTNTVAHTTSVSHSSDYTPVSSAEVGPQAQEMQRDDEPPLSSANAKDESKQSQVPVTSSYAGLEDMHTDPAVSSTTESVPVSHTSIGITRNHSKGGLSPLPRQGSRSGLYRHGRGAGSAGGTPGLSITAGIAYNGPSAVSEEVSHRVSDNSHVKDNEEDETSPQPPTSAMPVTTRSDEPSRPSPEAGMAGVNQDVVIVPSTFEATSATAVVSSSASVNKARVARSCTPPAAADFYDGGDDLNTRGAPIPNPLAENTRTPLKHVEPAFAQEGVIAVLSFLCEENRMDVANIPSSVFHSHCLPPMTVRDYVKRVVTYSQCSVEALLCGLILLLKYSFYSQHPVTAFNVHRLFIASVVLAEKLRDDQYYSNKYYASIGGIKPTEINRLEVNFLTQLKWFISIRVEEYEGLVDLLESLLEVPTGAVRMPQEPSVLAQFAREHGEMVSSYDLMMDVDDVTLKREDADEVRRLHEASQEELNNWKLERAFRRYHWRAAIYSWLERLQREQLATDKQYDSFNEADWAEEEARWTRYRQAERQARSSTSSEGSSRWMSPLTVNPPTAVQWPTAAMPTFATTTTPQRQQAGHHHSTGHGGAGRSAGTSFSSGNMVSSSGGGGTVVPARTRYANYPDYVQQSVDHLGSGLRYGGGGGGSHTGSGRPTGGIAALQNYAFSAAGIEQPHAPRVSPGGVSHTHMQQQQQQQPQQQSLGNSTGIYGRGGLQSTAPPHQTHHSFTAWSQQRKATSATAPDTHAFSTAPVSASSPASASTPSSRLNANAEPYCYVSSRQKRAQGAASTTATTTTASKAVSPAHVDAHEHAVSASSWRCPTDGVVPVFGFAKGGQFPAAPPQGFPSTTGADGASASAKAVVAFAHVGGVTGEGHGTGAREEEWAASRRHSSGSAGIAAQVAGRKRRKPQNYVDYQPEK